METLAAPVWRVSVGTSYPDSYWPLARPPHPTIAEIQRTVAQHFGLPVEEMKSCRRARVVARPRQMAMYFAARLTPRSLPEIGRHFGGRDHTTVMHAIKQVEMLRESDPEAGADVRIIASHLGGYRHAARRPRVGGIKPKLPRPATPRLPANPSAALLSALRQHHPERCG